MTVPTDWADDVAAQVVTYAYAYPNAREIIAEVLRLTYVRGEQSGMERTKQIYTEAFSQGGTP